MKKANVLLSFETDSVVDASNIVGEIVKGLSVAGLDAKVTPMVDDVLQGFAGTAPPVDQITVYTDGGCHRKKDGLGAWAYLIHFPDGRALYGCNGVIGTTNNRMELAGIWHALKLLTPGPPVKLYSDSQYAIRGLTEWAYVWKKTGWVTADKKPVKNKELWQDLLEVRRGHSVTFEHVKGHSGHEHNDFVDRLCTLKMLETHNAYVAGERVTIDNLHAGFSYDPAKDQEASTYVGSYGS